MRDIVQVSIGISNPIAGTFAKGSVIQPITPEILDDGFLDAEGYMYDLSELFDDGELWS